MPSEPLFNPTPASASDQPLGQIIPFPSANFDSQPEANANFRIYRYTETDASVFDGTVWYPNVPLEMVMPDPTREEVDAKIAASEARTDTKLAKIDGKLDLVIAKIDHVTESNSFLHKEIADSRRAVIANGWIIFAAIIAVIAILVTAGPSLFDLGMKIADKMAAGVSNAPK